MLIIPQAVASSYQQLTASVLIIAKLVQSAEIYEKNSDNGMEWGCGDSNPPTSRLTTTLSRTSSSNQIQKIFQNLLPCAS